MDIQLTERNWRIAAKIVLHELVEKRKGITARIESNKKRSNDYDGSELASVDEFELEMIDRAISALADILA